MGNPANLRPRWQPGQSGNPSGRPRVPDELRGIASLSQIECCKLVSKYARMSKEELQIAVQNPKTPVIELAIASIFAQSIKNGDYQRLSFLLDRAIGKVPVHNEDSEDIAVREELRQMTREELVAKAKELMPELKAG